MGIIRTLLAVCVIVAHSGPLLGYNSVGGKVAVQCFFIISGFYMAMILKEKYQAKENAYWLFISNRFLRIFPLYWAVLLIVFVFSCYVFAGDNSSEIGLYSSNILNLRLSFFQSLFLLFTNLFIFFQDTVMFLSFNGNGLKFVSDFRTSSPPVYGFLFVPQAWTIALELLFYTIAPFLVKLKTGTIFFLIILSVGIRYLLYSSGLNFDPWTYRFFPAELGFFLLGIIAYELYCRFSPSVVIQKISFLYLLIFIIFFDRLHIWHKEEILYGSFVLLLPAIFEFTKSTRFDREIGELSYPIYILHIFIIQVMDFFHVESTLLAILLSVVFSFIITKTITKKIEDYRASRITKLKTV